MAKKTVYDISKWNVVNDYMAFTQAADGVIARIGFRGNKTGVITDDNKFDAHIRNLMAHNENVGVYFFTNAVNEREAIEDADWTINKVEKMGIKLSFPIFVDTETGDTKTHTGRADNISKEARTIAVKAFVARCKERGYDAGIYAGDFWFFDHLNYDAIKDIKKWVASYSYPIRKVQDNIVGWQKSSNASVAGVVGRVDISEWYENIDVLGKYEEPKKEEPKPVVEKKVEEKKAEPKKEEKAKSNVTTVTKNNGKLEDGQEINIKDAKLYSSSTAAKSSGTKTGKFYVWSSVKRNSRIRICKSTKDLGNVTKVVGWISVSDIK